MIGIYKITNLVNGKIYIGQSIHIERRWVEHCNPSSNSVISKAIQKYGKDNFNFEVIKEFSTQDFNKLDEYEDYYIHYYNSLVPYGYNVSENTGVQHTTFITLNKEQYNEIVDLLKNTNETFDSIALKFGVSRRTITRINNGYTHKMPNLTYPIRLSEYGISPQFLELKEDKANYCIECGKKITYKSVRCSTCASINSRLVNRPNREDLKNLIRNNSFVAIGKLYNVSDNSIRKWCKSVNLPFRRSDIDNMSDEEWNLL